jgi:hypothetical protein
MQFMTGINRYQDMEAECLLSEKHRIPLNQEKILTQIHMHQEILELMSTVLSRNLTDKLLKNKSL